MSDGELVRHALAGQAGAYEELVRRWAGRVTAFCHAKVRRADVAEDLAQESLLRSYRGLTTLAQPDKFGSWLFGIALRACLDWLKAKERTTVPFSALTADGNPDQFSRIRQPTEPALDQQEEAARLMAEVESLPDECREVVMLYYYEDVTYRELGGMLGVSAATINARLTKARALLRERLAGRNLVS